MKLKVVLNRLAKYGDNNIDDEFALDLLDNITSKFVNAAIPVSRSIPLPRSIDSGIKMLSSSGDTIVTKCSITDDIKEAYNYHRINLDDASNDGCYVLKVLRSKFPSQNLTSVAINKIIHEIYPTRFNSLIVKRWGKDKANKIISDFLSINK